MARHNVAYVLIGALAGRLYGFPRVTADIDIAPAQADANLRQLARALTALNARVYTEAVPEGLAFDCSVRTLKRAGMWNLVTDAGRVDIAFIPAGTRGYDDLAQNAERFTVFGTVISVASLDDIIRSKQAANRPKDRADVLMLKELKKRQLAAATSPSTHER
jgi:hypothetical protein